MLSLLCPQVCSYVSQIIPGMLVSLWFDILYRHDPSLHNHRRCVRPAALPQARLCANQAVFASQPLIMSASLPASGPSRCTLATHSACHGPKAQQPQRPCNRQQGTVQVNQQDAGGAEGHAAPAVRGRPVHGPALAPHLPAHGELRGAAAFCRQLGHRIAPGWLQSGDPLWGEGWYGAARSLVLLQLTTLQIGHALLLSFSSLCLSVSLSPDPFRSLSTRLVPKI